MIPAIAANFRTSLSEIHSSSHMLFPGCLERKAGKLDYTSNSPTTKETEDTLCCEA